MDTGVDTLKTTSIYNGLTQIKGLQCYKVEQTGQQLTWIYFVFDEFSFSSNL